MRITPLLCQQCGSWFQPKTKRKNRFCCNACRQAHYNKKEPKWFYFEPETQSETEELMNTLCEVSPGEGPDKCLEILFEEQYDKYCEIVYKWGVDCYGVNSKDWLQSKSKTTL